LDSLPKPEGEVAMMRRLAFVAIAAWLVTPLPALAANCEASPAPGVDWRECRKRNLMIDASDLSGAILEGADFSSSDLRKSKLDATNFSKAGLARAMLDGSSARDSNFEKALGYRTSFVGTDLGGARFAKSEMQRADFTNAVLKGADFEKSELGRVILTGADINDAKFGFANLARADFRGAVFSSALDFTGAYLYRTRFDGVDLSAATGLQQWQVDLACGDASTKLPAGLAAPASWPCTEE
jgi:uncharacterized protein YjbI with pentapeptide repeats